MRGKGVIGYIGLFHPILELCLLTCLGDMSGSDNILRECVLLSCRVVVVGLLD